jgi:uncharacterized protein (TIGR03435 family)
MLDTSLQMGSRGDSGGHARLVSTCALLVVLSQPTGAGQTPDLTQASPESAFDVVSVRQRDSAGGPMSAHVPPRGTVTFSNYPAAWLILYAYTLDGGDQLVGVPEWAWSDRFDVMAVPPPDASREDVPRMLRSMLASRFNLRTRWEDRQTRVYALTVAREDGRLGPGLQPSDYDCAAYGPLGSKAGEPEPVDQDGRRICRRVQTIGADVSTTIVGGTLSDLVQFLKQWSRLDRPIVDRTGLTGNYDLSISFAPPSRLGTSSSTAAGRPGLHDVHGALSEQLGLRLEQRDDSMRVLVVDSLEHPTPN